MSCLGSYIITNTRSLLFFNLMDWESAKKYCIDRNWQWTLDLINQAQKEIRELELENSKLKEKINK